MGRTSIGTEDGNSSNQCRRSVGYLGCRLFQGILQRVRGHQALRSPGGSAAHRVVRLLPFAPAARAGAADWGDELRDRRRRFPCATHLQRCQPPADMEPAGLAMRNQVRLQSSCAPLWFLAAIAPMLASEIVRLSQTDPLTWIACDYVGRIVALAALAAVPAARAVAFPRKRIGIAWWQVALCIRGKRPPSWRSVSLRPPYRQSSDPRGRRGSADRARPHTLAWPELPPSGPQQRSALFPHAPRD